MSPEAQRIAIAEACGWRTQRESWPSGEKITWLAPYTVPGYLGAYSPPDFLNDLNAMHEAEKFRWTGDLERLHNDASVYREWKDYRSLLRHNVHAEAKERAWAFLQVTNLWDETK